MLPNGRVRPTLLLVKLAILILKPIQEEADGATVKRETSTRNDVFEQPDHGFDFDKGEGRAASEYQEKELLPPDAKTGVVSMLYKDKDGKEEKLSDLTTNDIIIRLQEKYEGPVCQSYLKSVPNLETKYFQYNTSYIPYQDLDVDPGPKYKKRYRLLQELCNKENELAFWREMFEIAETDQRRNLMKTPSAREGEGEVGENDDNTTTTPTTTPTPVDPLLHLKDTEEKLMERWNKVWLKYQDHSVCNQKLLLECRDPRPGERDRVMKGKTHPALGVCECRPREVSIPSIFPQGNIYNVDGRGRFERTFVSLYYENAKKTVNGKEVIVRTGNLVKDYIFHNRCAVTANIAPFLFDRPMLITNPCDFSLPMIGQCTSLCVSNSSCVSATPEEKADMRERAGKDTVERIRDRKVHSVFHNKCQCENGKLCYLAGTTFFKQSGQLSIYPGSFLALTTFSLIILYTFHTTD